MTLTKKQLANNLLEEIIKLFPAAKTELANWSTDFQFLLCIILSAQTTDKQVNTVTEQLFAKFPTPEKLSRANQEDVEALVSGINYYKTKAKNIIKTATTIVEEYNGEVPRTIEELVKLPGVGYKTANVFLNDMYQSNQGIAVDTHVKRIAKAYGLTKEEDPTKIAHDLEKLYPKEKWYLVNTNFVLYGRYIFKAKKPDTERFVLKEYIVL